MNNSLYVNNNVGYQKSTQKQLYNENNHSQQLHQYSNNQMTLKSSSLMNRSQTHNINYQDRSPSLQPRDNNANSSLMGLAPLSRRLGQLSDQKNNNNNNSVLIQDTKYEQQSVNMTYIFESLYIDNSNINQTTTAAIAPVNDNNNTYDNQEPNTNTTATNNNNINTTYHYQGQIKMMDTILFEKGFQPKKWIFTDLLGRIQYKDINSITINDVIRAFLVNLNENKKNEFNNEDLIEFLSNSKNRSKICFAISGNTRHFLDIGALSDIKNKFPKGIDALQLYKIPTREFLPYFYYHTLNFKNSGQLHTHMIVRVSHYVKDLGSSVSQSQVEFYEEKIPDEEYEYFAYQMLEVSKQLISRMQARNPESIVKSIKITYLVESSNYDPWFIGTEFCNILTKQREKHLDSIRKNHLSKSFMQQSANNRLSSYSNRQQLNSVQKRSFVKKLKEDVSSQRIIHHQQQDLLQPNESTTSADNNNYNYIDGQDANDTSQQQYFDNHLPNEDVFELSTNEYVTQSDLLRGLQQIGEQYGRDQQLLPTDKIKRPRTMQVLTQEKSRRMLRYQQQINDQRNKLKEKGRRIVDLFPRYLEKSGSKPHAQFLFGNVSSDRIFKDYQRLRFQKQQLNTEPDILKTDSIMQNKTTFDITNNNKQQSLMNRSIFDIPMSEIGVGGQASMIATNELPYQDGYYNINNQQQNTLMMQQAVDQFQNLTELNEELILNKDISMFQQTSVNPQQLTDPPQAYTATQNGFYDRNSSMKEASIMSGRDDLLGKTTASNFGDKILKTTQKDYLNESFKESQKLDEDKLVLANTDFEKNLISLMMINQELENIVVLDKNKALGNIRSKIQRDEQTKRLQSQTIGGSASDQVFTNRRRKLDREEMRTFYQWKQQSMLQNNDPQYNQNNNISNYIYTSQYGANDNIINESQHYNNNTNINSTLPLVKYDKQHQHRSKTATGYRKSSSKLLRLHKPSALSLLQIKGQEAKVEVGSKLELIKQHVVQSRQQQEQQMQKQMSLNSRNNMRNNNNNDKSFNQNNNNGMQNATKYSDQQTYMNNNNQQDATTNKHSRKTSLGYNQQTINSNRNNNNSQSNNNNNNLQTDQITLSAKSSNNITNNTNTNNINSMRKQSQGSKQQQQQKQRYDLEDPTKSKAVFLRIIQDIQKVADN